MKGIKILLVEDDEWDIDLMRYSLKKRNIAFEIDIYNHGIAAARSFEKVTEVPDIIVLDLNLPGINGDELLKLIRKNSLLQNVPVLMLTNTHREGYMEAAMKQGASKFLIKAVDVKDMDTVIDTMVALACKPAN